MEEKGKTCPQVQKQRQRGENTGFTTELVIDSDLKGFSIIVWNSENGCLVRAYLFFYFFFAWHSLGMSCPGLLDRWPCSNTFEEGEKFPFVASDARPKVHSLEICLLEVLLNQCHSHVSSHLLVRRVVVERIDFLNYLKTLGYSFTISTN